MTDLTVKLSPEMAAFVRGLVADGAYATPEDVVTEALSLLADIDAGMPADEAELEWQRRAYQEGIESGSAGQLDFEELKREARRRFSR